jgi:hypothetical protein
MIAMDGREMPLYNNHLVAGHQLIQLNVGNLPKGVYVLNIREEEEGNQYNKQIVIR